MKIIRNYEYYTCSYNKKYAFIIKNTIFIHRTNIYDKTKLKMYSEKNTEQMRKGKKVKQFEKCR